MPHSPAPAPAPAEEAPAPLQTGAISPELASAGKMQILSLGAVKARLGDRWQRASERVRARLEEALRPRMKPGDVLLPLDDVSFLIVFANRSKQEAQLECFAAAREVLLKLFGDQAADVQVRTVVGQVDGELTTETVDPQALVEAALERDGEVLIVEASSPSDLAEARAARDEAQRAGPERTVDEVALRPPVFVYQPLWNYTKGAVFAYMCEAELDPRVNELDSFAAEQETAEADFALLGNVEAELADAFEHGRRLMIYARVRFSTLTHWRHGPAYFRRLAELGPAASQLLVLVVSGIHQGAPHSRLVEFLPRLAGYGRAVYCEVDPDDSHLARIANLGVRALGLRWSAECDRDAGRVAETFAVRAGASGFSTFATALDTPASVVAALAAGVTELCGSAVRPPADRPDTAYRLTLVDLFAGLMPSAPGRPPQATAQPRAAAR